jgi:hypothetical protein
MLDLFRSKLTKDRERDLTGFVSIREFCFDAFQSGLRPGELRHRHPWLKTRTVMTYFTDWKLIAGTAEERPPTKYDLAHLREYLHDPVLRKKMVSELSHKYQLPPEVIEDILRRPHAITGIPRGRTNKKLATLAKLNTLDIAIGLIDRCKELDIPIAMVLDKAVTWATATIDFGDDMEEMHQRELTEAERQEFNLNFQRMLREFVTMNLEAKAEIRKFMAGGDLPGLKSEGN